MMDLKKLANVDRQGAIYLAIREIWYGRNVEEISIRLGKSQEWFKMHRDKMLERFPSVFYMYFGMAVVYMDWKVIPDEYKNSVERIWYDKLFPVGYHGRPGTTIIEVSSRFNKGTDKKIDSNNNPRKDTRTRDISQT